MRHVLKEVIELYSEAKDDRDERGEKAYVEGSEKPATPEKEYFEDVFDSILHFIQG